MPQTRLGSSSVTSAIVTACSSGMLETSCPPGTSFPTCLLQLCPSEFGKKLLRQLMGVYEVVSVQGCGSWDPAALWVLASSLRDRNFWALPCPSWIGIAVLGYIVDLPPPASFSGALQIFTWALMCLFQLAPPLASLGWHFLKTLLFNGYSVVMCISKCTVTLFYSLFYGDYQISGFWAQLCALRWDARPAVAGPHVRTSAILLPQLLWCLYICLVLWRKKAVFLYTSILCRYVA